MVSNPELAIVFPEAHSIKIPETGASNPTLTKTWFAINDYLGHHERYPENSRLSRYVQERVGFLSDSDDIETFVVRDDSLEAFAMPGYIVISDGLIKTFEYKEELDGVLAHETTHIKHGHVTEDTTPDTLTRAIGRRRAHETEADFVPVELLDEKGINPLGIVSAFKKIGDKGYNPVTSLRLGDYEHGSLQDRRLNLEESAWLIDVRNLKNEMEKLTISEQDFNEYQQDSRLFDSYSDFDALSKRHLLQRQFSKIQKDIEDGGVSDEIKARMNTLLDRQRDLVREQGPSLSEEEINDLVVMIVGGSFLNENKLFTLSDAGLDLKDWTSEFIDAQRIRDFMSMKNHKVIKDLGITINADNLDRIGKAALYSYLMADDAPNLPNYFELVASLKEAHYTSEFLYEPLYEYLLEKGRWNNETARVLGQFLTDTDVKWTQFDAYAYSRHSTKENLIFSEKKPFKEARSSRGLEYIEDRSGFNSTQESIASKHLQTELIRLRLQALRTKINDPVEFARALSNFEEELDVNDMVAEERDKLTDAVLGPISVNKMLTLIREWETENSTSIEGQEFIKQILQFYSEDQVRISPYDLEFRADAIVDYKKLPDLLLLWAVCGEKGTFLDFTRDSLEAVIRSEHSPFKGTDDVSQVFKTIRDIPQKARQMGFSHVNWDVEMNDLKRLGVLLKTAEGIYLQSAAQNKDPKILVDLVSSLPVYNVRVGSGESERDEAVASRTARSWNIIRRLLIKDGHILDSDSSMEELFALGSVSENTQVLLQVPQGAAESMVRDIPFDEGVRMVFEKYQHLPRHIFTKAIEYLIEQKARTLDDFSILEDKVRSEISDFMANDELVGQLAIGDFLLDPYRQFSGNKTRRVGIRTDEVRGMQPIELLDALFKTSQNDKEFKEYMFERWWFTNRTGGELEKYFSVEDITFLRQRGKEAMLNRWTQEIPPAGRYKPLSSVVTDAYLSSSAMKYAILRKTLVGQGGVLNTPEGRKALEEAFLGSWVDFEESTQGEQMTRELVDSLLSVGSEDELYQRLNPILSGMILKLPRSYHSYQNLAHRFAHNKLIEMRDSGTISTPNVRDRDAIEAKVRTLVLGGQKKQDTLLDLSDTNSELLSLFTDNKERYEDKAMTPWELAITVGEKSGAVGVRMLQLAGQYFDIPQEQRERLMDVYDQMQGQSRLQAYRVLKREAQHSPEIAELLDQITEIFPRIGGGSLMTVYDVRLKDGSREAIAVRNPNVEYHVEKTVDLARRTIGKASEANPDDRNYQLLEALSSDVQEWVHDELTDPNFEEKDRRFKEENDYRYRNFDVGNNKYRILVPQSSPTGTRWVRRDEFIDGKNLTALIPTNEDTDIMAGKINIDDYKQVVSLLVRNYLYQMLDTGLVHSDIHPGNFRVTADNSSLAVFDRYNLLELNKDDKRLLEGFISSFRGGGAQRATRHVVDYVLGLEENSLFTSKKRELLEQASSSSSGDVERGILDSIVFLKRSGVHIPIKIALIGKNLQVLNRMSKDAGFENLAEAYKSTAKVTDLLKFAIMR